MEYRELLTGFAKACGLDGLTFDDEGVAVILADDISLSFMEVPEARRLVMFADVARTTPSGNCERLYKALLEAQHLGMATGGATFSISPEGKISLYRLDPLVDLDVEVLTKIVENFLDLIDRWREIIAAYRPDEPSEEEEPREEEPLEQETLENSGFMRV